MKSGSTIGFAAQIVILLFILASPCRAGLLLGPEELVEADGLVIEVPGYSVPSFAYWDDDGLKDLIVGEGGDSHTDGKVRVYLNIGTETDPVFGDHFYAQSEGTDLVSIGEG